MNLARSYCAVRDEPTSWRPPSGRGGCRGHPSAVSEESHSGSKANHLVLRPQRGDQRAPQSLPANRAFLTGRNGGRRAPFATPTREPTAPAPLRLRRLGRTGESHCVATPRGHQRAPRPFPCKSALLKGTQWGRLGSLCDPCGVAVTQARPCSAPWSTSRPLKVLGAFFLAVVGIRARAHHPPSYRQPERGRAPDVVFFRGSSSPTC